MKIGAQLYTLRTFCDNEINIDETFKKVAAMGYEYVQVSGLADIGAANLREIADRYGLKIILTHSNQDRVINDTAALIEEHKIMGASYIGIGSMPGRYHNDIAAFVRDFKPAAQKIAAAGMKFMYHNHDFEFAKIDGKLMMEHLMDEFTAEEMGFVLDVFWVQAGGADPAAWLRKLAGRVDTIHFKDFGMLPGRMGEQQSGVGSATSPETGRAMMPILEGNMNWDAIFEACKDAGVQYAFVEQDDCNGVCPFECLQTSFDNLKAKGF